MDGTTVITQLAGSLGASGVLAWYCWYVTSTTLPRLVDEFRAETKAIREEAAKEREHHSEQTERIAQVMQQMLEKCRAGNSEPVRVP